MKCFALNHNNFRQIFAGKKKSSNQQSISCIFGILTSPDDKDDNDIIEERDDDRLFDLFFDGERLRDLVLWRPRLNFFPLASEAASAAAVGAEATGTTARSAERLLAFDELSIFNNVM